MKRSKASGETAALVLSGNAGVGATFPFSGAFFVLLTAPTVLPVLSAGDIVAAMFVTGVWMVLMRVVIAAAIVRKRGVGAMATEDIRPFRTSFRAGWPSLVVLGSIALPIIVASSALVANQTGLDADDVIPMLIWLPMVMLIVGLIVERKSLPRGRSQWWSLLGTVSPKLGLVGMTMISAFAASNVLNTLGLGKQLAPYMTGLTGVPQVIAAIVVGLIIVIVAGPLNTTSTVAAVGPVAFVALTTAGIPAPVAFAAILVWASSEGCSPPGAAPLYVAAGIAEINPVRIFIPVVLYYLIPTLVVGILLATGILWIPT
ncbi:TRAP transporter large permease subunit [Kibdelosporangium aridum]|uniref:TRAP-type C4-dicarboxylate transport system, large permease component n=1 Tax=Kibdelosporangium aridum TaxID=2030 RepID=A0A1W2ED42_KIBAR|nr:TRAP transporter large permease subunit [Kibdelosporangium aridum]SMD07312.1 TRAP-type C4-dicarboxylate transport system, large permease component [Kibdelosporangium aridum]